MDYKLEAYNGDIFDSVTKDDNHVYVKLVNADPFEKTTKLMLKDLSVDTTGKKSRWSNVNKKNAEQIVPSETEIKLDDNGAVVTLSANSVSVIILDLK